MLSDSRLHCVHMMAQLSAPLIVTGIHHYCRASRALGVTLGLELAVPRQQWLALVRGDARRGRTAAATAGGESG